MNVAILVANYFEQAELVQPKEAMKQAGFSVDIISAVSQELQGMNADVNMADTFTRDKDLSDARASDYDALIVPGGTVNADTLRQDETARAFVTEVMRSGKPVAVICHGPWVLVSADLVKDKTLTSFPSLETDVRNAGGNWVDKPVVVDGNLITSRNPDDIPDFNQAILSALKR